MPIIDGMNNDYVSYFPLEEYINRIKLLPRLLEHLEHTNKEFDLYMKKLSNYDQDYIIDYWIYLLYEERQNNNKIENKSVDLRTICKEDAFFDNVGISHKKIHRLHNYVMNEEQEGYRKKEVNVSRKAQDGTEEIFWRGANACDVNRFMSDFLKVYKQSGTSLIYSNPFLVSSLMHLLFLRIHPYTDGNGRTSRIIHNIRFTKSINNLYGTRLKLSPLNLSESIELNKITYIKRIDNIYFDLENDTNEEINDWFNFMLDMADEQLYRSNQKLEQTRNLTFPSREIDIASKMRLSRIK